jgi:hypothetical protein
MKPGPVATQVLAALWLAAGSHPARADEGDAMAAARAQIRTERAAAGSRLQTRESECLAKFVVTPCLDDARRENREALARLRHREAELDAQERKQRTDARRAEIADNQRRDLERQREASAPERRESLRQDAAPQVTVRPNARPLKPQRAASEADRQADEARNRADFEARQRAIEAHRDAVEARNLEKSAKGKVGAALPLPAASAP